MKPMQREFDFYLDTTAGPCFASWCVADGGSGGGAVVICSPFGREEVSAHATLRALACSLAVGGLSTLRFDFPGCGDSCGDDNDAELYQRWCDAVHAAVDNAKRLAGVQRVGIVGVRLGAAIAMGAALERDDIFAMSVIAPVLSGRRYVRELKAMRATSASSELRHEAASNKLEAGGYVVSGETLASLEAIDLQSMPRSPCPLIQLIERDDMSPDGKWVHHVRSLGGVVEHLRLSGFADMMQDPQYSRVAVSIIEAVVKWIAEVAPQAIGTNRGRPLDQLASSASLGEVVERMARVPALGNQLSGVLSMPSPAKAQLNGDAVMLLNAGATPRTGPGRMYVVLARQLAAKGYTVLRLDLSGLGDSPPQSGQRANVVYPVGAVEEVTHALDYLRAQSGIERCHVIGLCSGAYHAFKAAVGGAPLDSVIAINPLTFCWRGGAEPPALSESHEVLSEITRVRAGLFMARRWRKLLRGQVDLKRACFLIWGWARTNMTGVFTDAARALRLPIRDDLAREIQTVLKHGVTLQFLFSVGEPGETLLRIHGGVRVARMRRAKHFDVRWVEGANHTFSSTGARCTAISTLLAMIDNARASAVIVDSTEPRS